MDALGIAGGGILYLAIAIFLFVLAIVWILLPFAIFGIKDRLDRIIVGQNKTNAELWELRSAMSRQVSAPPVQPSADDRTLGEIVGKQ